MKSKIVSLLVVALSITAISQAQTKTTFGIRAGVNFQNLNGKDAAGDDLENKLKTGFNVGANVEIPVGVDFYLQPGLLYSTKGSKSENSDGKINLSYLELPINFIYKPAIGNGHLVMGFGPYVGYALSGQIKPEDGDDIDIEFENEITPAQAISGTLYAKRFDAGANLLFGYEFSNKLSVQLNAGLGLVNISPEIKDVDTDTKTKNTGFGVSLGYRF